MPFTLAHPIVALPLWWCSRQRLDLSALMVGSLVPDLSYYVHLQPVRNSAHTLLGAMQVGVPWGMVLLLIGMYWVQRPSLALLPRGFRPISPHPYRVFPIARLVTVLLSLYIGAVSHIVWDSFTHRGGWGVVHWPLLATSLGPLPIYSWLQYGGGVFGLAGLAVWALWHYRLSPAFSQSEGERHPRPPFRGFRLIAVLCVLGGAIALAQVAATLPGTEAGLKPLVVRAVIGTVTGSSLGILLYSSLFWLWNGAKQLQRSQ